MLKLLQKEIIVKAIVQTTRHLTMASNMIATKLKFYTITTLTIVLGQLGITFPVYSQPITPAKDNTGTIINQNGNQFNI
ncbi:MAG: hypothetical protein O4805_14730, partial [Trichodesmium sp. St16_bin2-tuft]|nr:hypothetical protein [Trichodesmium sp. St16_bin2-tuft]